MSWSVKFYCTKENMEREIASAHFDEVLHPTVEENEHLHIARVAALKMWENLDTLGNYPKYEISFSGHANPDHVEKPGYADDEISVRIRGISRQWT